MGELAGEEKSSLEQKEILAKQGNSAALDSMNWGRKKLQDEKLLSGLIRRRELWFKQMRELRSKMNDLMGHLRATERGLYAKLGKERLFKLHELVQLAADHKHLENLLKIISARLKNMQSKFAIGKHTEKKILSGYKVREGILGRSLKRERGEEISA